MRIAWISGLTLAAAASLGICGANAADLPTRKEAPAPYTSPIYNWTGFYIGANLGAVWGTGNLDVTGSPAFVALGPTLVPGTLGNATSAEIIGGGQIGYNFQVSNFVWGVEADIDGTGLNHSGSFTGGPLPGALGGGTLTTSASERLEWLGTARLRLGVTPFDRSLLYITGGLAYGGATSNGSVVANGAGIAWNGSSSTTRVGWSLGGGGEYAITNNISLRAEYLYYDLGSQDNTALGNAAAIATPALDGVFLQTRERLNGSIARVGVNYKF